MYKNKIIVIITLILMIASILFISGCTTPEVITINAGNPIIDQISTATEGRDFKVYLLNVPSGINSLVITLTQLDDDFDLYVGYGSYSSVEGENYDWRSRNDDLTPEYIYISNPQAGNYYIQVYLPGDYGGSYTLLADID